MWEERVLHLGCKLKISKKSVNLFRGRLQKFWIFDLVYTLAAFRYTDDYFKEDRPVLY